MNLFGKVLAAVLLVAMQLISSQKATANHGAVDSDDSIPIEMEAQPCEFAGNTAQQGSFSVGYEATFETQGNGTSIDITFKILDTDKVGLVGFLWQQSPFKEFQMTDLGDNTFGITIDDLTSGSTVSYACKFAFAGGLVVTEYIQYIVGDVCEADPTQDATLSDLKVDNVSIPDFSPDKFNYTYFVDASAMPTVSVTTTQSGANANIDPADGVPGTTTIVVTAEDGATTATYRVNFDLQRNFSLVWSDEFEGSGAINTERWHHQTVPIINGVAWANNEEQHYTNRVDNSMLEGGVMKIVAKREIGYQQNGVTRDYTSARLNAKFAFTYGRVDVRAKLPSQLGTWPAIWTLGQNISETGAYWQTQGFGTTPWPTVGEIDLMEQFGFNANDKEEIHGSTHTPRSFGATENTAKTALRTAATGFHVYSIIWDATEIKFLIDDVEFYAYNPTEQYGEKNANPNDSNMNWPFDKPQYLILNVAMGGNLGGPVPASFTEGIMEIDYVRVFQEEGTLTAEGASFEIDENSSDGTLIGTISTEYLGGLALEYAITGGNEDGAFGINAATGMISVADGGVLDFDQQASYSLAVTVTDGVFSETATVNIALNPAAVTSVGRDRSDVFKVYPNPVNHLLTLRVDEVHQPLSYFVTDISGRMMTVPGDKTMAGYQLDFSRQRRGTYLLTIHSGNGDHHFRIMKN